MDNPINLTEKAIKKIRELTVKSQKYALRLDLKKGGCAGMEYFMEYVDKVEENEEIIDFDGAKVIIAPLDCPMLKDKSSRKKKHIFIIFMIRIKN